MTSRNFQKADLKNTPSWTTPPPPHRASTAAPQPHSPAANTSCPVPTTGWARATPATWNSFCHSRRRWCMHVPGSWKASQSGRRGPRAVRGLPMFPLAQKPPTSTTDGRGTGTGWALATTFRTPRPRPRPRLVAPRRKVPRMGTPGARRAHRV